MRTLRGVDPQTEPTERTAGAPPRGAGQRGRRGLALLPVVALVSTLLFHTGCGTLITQVDGPLFAPGKKTFNWDGKESSPVYSGTRLSWGGVRKSEVFYVWIVDLPLSFVADTAILPLSLLQDGLARVFVLFEEESVIEPEATPMP